MQPLPRAIPYNMRKVENGADALQDLASSVGNFEPDRREHPDDVRAVNLIDGLPANQREDMVPHAGNPVAIVLVFPAYLQRCIAFARCGLEARHNLARLAPLGNRIDPSANLAAQCSCGVTGLSQRHIER